MSNVRGFTGIVFRPRSFDSKADKSKAYLSSTALYHLQNWTRYNDQICLTREKEKEILDYEVKAVEPVSTGVTKEMLEKLISGKATADEIDKIKTMLLLATAHDVSKLPEKSLITISKYLLSNPDNGLTIITTILSSPLPTRVLREIDENPELLNYEKIPLELMVQILSCPDSRVLELLEEYPELLNNKRITPELWNQILESEKPYNTYKILITLLNHPTLIDKLTPVLWSEVLSSAAPDEVLIALSIYPEKIITELWDSIRSSKDPNAVLEALIKHPEWQNEEMTEFWDLVLASQKPDAILSGLEQYPWLLKNAKMTAFWTQILIFSNPEEVIMALGENPALLENDKMTIELFRKIIEHGGSFAAANLRILGQNPELLKNDKITTEFLSQIMAMRNAEFNLRALAKNLKVLENNKITTEILIQIIKSDKPNYLLEILDKNLNLLTNDKITTESLSQIIASNNALNIFTAVNARLELIKNDKISIELLIQMLSCKTPNDLIRAFVIAVIGNDGKVDVEIVKSLRDLVKIKDPRHNAHVNRIFNLLETDDKFQALIENVKAPGNYEGSETVKSNIRTMLQIGEDIESTKVDAQRAVLGAVLSDLRQGRVGSCYGTAIAICVHDTIPHLMVEDLTNIIEKGYFVRQSSFDYAEERFYAGEAFDFSDRTKWKDFGILKQLSKLSITYPEFADVFLKAKTAAKSSSSSVLDVIFDELAKHFEITEDDLKKEKELSDLSNMIRVLSVEASLNQDEYLDQKVNHLINEYDKKSNELGKKSLNLESYHRAHARLSKILFIEGNNGENLLTKSWEYAILSAELREIESERQLSSKKIPLMMREVFKEALFNNDEGAIFIEEMQKSLETLQDLKSGFSPEQEKQLSALLMKLVKTMKSVVDKRITVRTLNVGKSDTAHYMVYAMGEEVGKFKVLDKEEEYSAAIVGCMMESFEELFEQNPKMNEEIKGFLIKAKGILGDQLQSEEFRDSLNALVVNSSYMRFGEERQAYDSRVRRISSIPIVDVYFEQAYSRNLLQIETPAREENPIFRKFIEWRVSTKKQADIRDKQVGIRDIESEYDFMNYLEGFKDYIEAVKQKPFTTSIALMGVCAVGGFSWLAGGVTIGVLAIGETLLTRSDDYKTPATDLLTHFIEANRIMFKNVKCHDAWVKYPVRVHAHVCNLIPFNKSVRGIVESNEDIGQYIQRLIENPEKTTIAVMDLNYPSDRCYVGFELGNGEIRKVCLNSQFKVVPSEDVEQFFKFAYTSESSYKAVDEKISRYSEGFSIPNT